MDQQCHYVGLDVSLETTSICIIDDAGAIIWRGKCHSDPDTITAIVRQGRPRKKSGRYPSAGLHPDPMMEERGVDGGKRSRTLRLEGGQCGDRRGWGGIEPALGERRRVERVAASLRRRDTLSGRHGRLCRDQDSGIVGGELLGAGRDAVRRRRQERLRQVDDRWLVVPGADVSSQRTPRAGGDTRGGHRSRPRFDPHPTETAGALAEDMVAATRNSSIQAIVNLVYDGAGY
jgi:hypothetical protein